MIVGGEGLQRQAVAFEHLALEEAVDADVVADDGEAVLLQKGAQVVVREGRFERAELAHHAAQFLLARGARGRPLAFEDEEQAAALQQRREVADDGALVLEVVERVVADDGVELPFERRALHVVDEEAAAHGRLVIGAVRDFRDALARDLYQVGADVDALVDVAEAREVFGEPAEPQPNVEDAARGRECERVRHVGEVAEVPVRVFVQTFDLYSATLREVVEGLRAQMMLALS